MIFEDGKKYDDGEVRRETRVFREDTTLEDWHGVTFAGQEYKYNVKSGVITLMSEEKANTDKHLKRKRLKK